MLTLTYRPKTYDDVVGMEFAIKILRNSVKSKAVSNVYLFSGSFGSGKCVSGDTRVLSEKGYTPIRDLYENPKEGFQKMEIDVSNGYSTRKTSEFYFESEAWVNYLELENGLVINGTNNHKVSVYDPANVRVDLLETSQITEGSIIALSQNVFQTLVRDRISYEEAFILGFYAGDGSHGKRKNEPYKFMGSSESIRLLESLFGREFHWVPDKRRNDLVTISLPKDFQHNVVQYLERGSSEFKRVPSVIFKSSDKVRVGFLEGYLHTDGSVDKKGQIEFVSKSSLLLRDVQDLFLSIGCHGRLSVKEIKSGTYKGNVYHRFILHSWSRDRFFSYLRGLSSKTIRIENAVDFTKSCIMNQRNYIPFKNKEFIVDEIRAWRVKFQNRFKGDLGCVTASNIKQCGVTTQQTLLNLKTFYGELPPSLEGLIGFTFVKVKSIYKVKESVYDVCVPEGHTFFAQGVINHNTTIARIFVRALMCKEPTSEGVSCDKCDSCLAALNENNIDYVEKDAASSGLVDDVRKLREDSEYAPIFSNRKVVLLDECQNLTKQAQSALLKLFEDGSKYVTYIMCTTDPEKLLPTVRSRCIEIPVTTVSQKAVISRLQYICERESLDFDPPALALIATYSRGHLRDAIMFLEKVILTGGISEDNVRQYLGLDVKADSFKTLLALNENPNEFFTLYNNLMSRVSPTDAHTLFLECLTDAYEIGVTGTLNSLLEAKLAHSLWKNLEKQTLTLASKLIRYTGKLTREILLMLLVAEDQTTKSSAVLTQRNVSQIRALGAKSKDSGVSNQIVSAQNIADILGGVLMDGS